MIQYEVIPGTSEVYIVFGGSGIGRCKFWLPEGVGTPRGLAGVYPSGMKWLEHDSGLRQGAAGDQLFGPGNVKEVEPGVIECCGVRSVKESPLPWNSSFIFGDTRVDFSLSVHNPHDHTLSDVCAVLCLKFMDAPWWDLKSCFFKTEQGIMSIAQTKWIDGRFPSFQKWHVGPEAPYDNPVQNGIWTSNQVRATLPMWVVQHSENGSSILFACESSYYIHSNKSNPCNDIALRFGDVQPGQTVERHGYIELAEGTPETLLSRSI